MENKEKGGYQIHMIGKPSTTADYKFIGKSVRRVDAREKVTGEAIYAGDLQVPGMLFGKIKRSPHPFARVLAIHTDKALELPGVKAVITARDVAQFPYGPFVADELPLADEYVRYIGDEVAAVAAVDENTAEDALDLIEIEYEQLTPVFDAEESMKPGAPVIHPEIEPIKNNTSHHLEFVRGEGVEAFKQADLIVEGTFSTQAVHQGYLEPIATVASWDTSGKLTIWCSLQGVHKNRPYISKALGIPEHQIRMVQTCVGGGFGGKGPSSTHHVFPISALLSRVTARPVKIVLTREEDFMAGRPRLTEKIHMRLGVKRDGTIVAKEATLTGDPGAFTGTCQNVINLSSSRTDNLYRTPNIKVTANLVYTNKVPRGSCRAIGNPQIHFALESLIDEAAAKLGMDPMEIRLKNCAQKGDTTPGGYVLNTCEMSQCIEIAAKKANWHGTKHRPVENHGFGMACQVHVSGAKGLHPIYDGSAALISVDQLGKVKIISGEVELGEGSSTVFAQIAAEQLGVPIEDIEVAPVDTDVSPFCLGTGATRVTVLGGNAVLMAAKDAASQLLAYAAKRLETNIDNIELRDGQFRVKGSSQETAAFRDIASYAVFSRGGVPVVGQGTYVVPAEIVNPDRKTRYGNISIAYPFSAQVAEVSVDTETGSVKVLNLWAVHDSGKIINPMLAEGQVEGGVMMGIGYALTEEYAFKEGRILNPNFTDYKMPLAPDTPRIHTDFVEEINPGSPYGAKGLGEPPITPVAPAIANAIYDAVGIRIRELPITAEKIAAALKKRQHSRYRIA